MALTEEQRERIQKNKERALAIRKKREKEKQKTGGYCTSQEDGSNNTTCTASEKNVPPTKTNEINVDKLQDDAPMEYEDFEIDASPFVSKQEASEKYCLPKGKWTGRITQSLALWISQPINLSFILLSPLSYKNQSHV
jgi:hypothetical protein